MDRSGLIAFELFCDKLKAPSLPEKMSALIIKDAECIGSEEIYKSIKDVCCVESSLFYGYYCGIYKGCNLEVMITAAPVKYVWPQDDDWVSDRDPNKDRAPRPERKKLPWSFGPFFPYFSAPSAQDII